MKYAKHLLVFSLLVLSAARAQAQFSLSAWNSSLRLGVIPTADSLTFSNVFSFGPSDTSFNPFAIQTVRCYCGPSLPPLISIIIVSADKVIPETYKGFGVIPLTSESEVLGRGEKYILTDNPVLKQAFITTIKSAGHYSMSDVRRDSSGMVDVTLNLMDALH